MKSAAASSVFGSKRTVTVLHERVKILKNKQAKLIIAWGKNSNIKELASMALLKLPEDRHVFGLRYNNSWRFRHPYPMIKKRCINWLEDMTKQLIRVTKD